MKTRSKRLVAMLLVLVVSFSVFSTAALAATPTEPNTIKQQIEYYESIEDYDQVEQIVDETFDKLFSSKTQIQTRAAIPPNVILDILAIYGAGYGGAYAVGQYCKNNNVPYAAGLATLLAVSSAMGNILNPIMQGILTLGYDNGYKS